LRTAKKVIATTNPTEQEAWQMLRGNAIECCGLHRFGVTR
jgi:hypothetical protein